MFWCFTLHQCGCWNLWGWRWRQGRYHYTGHVTFTGRDTTERYKSSRRRGGQKAEQGAALAWDAVWVCLTLSSIESLVHLSRVLPYIKTVRRWYRYELYSSLSFVFLSSQWWMCTLISSSTVAQGAWEVQMTLSNCRVFLASTDGSSLASVSGVKYSRWCLPQTGVVSFFHRCIKKGNITQTVRCPLTSYEKRNNCFWVCQKGKLHTDLR